MLWIETTTFELISQFIKIKTPVSPFLIILKSGIMKGSKIVATGPATSSMQIETL